jgi:hypothetical protein
MQTVELLSVQISLVNLTFFTLQKSLVFGFFFNAGSKEELGGFYTAQQLYIWRA